jgi:hypothetical protein
MKKLTLPLLILFFFSCTREEPGTDPSPAPPNTLLVYVGTDTIAAPIIAQQLSVTQNAAYVSLAAASSQIEVTLNAQSLQHSLGGGNYFFECCNNSVSEKFSGGQFYDGIANGTINSTSSEKGRFEVTNVNMEGYWGTFTFTGKNSAGAEKTFNGRFRVVY